MASAITEYTNLLHKVKDPRDSQAQQFKRQHENDSQFLRQAQVVELAFLASRSKQAPVDSRAAAVDA